MAKGYFGWMSNYTDTDDPCSNCNVSLKGQSEIYIADFFNDGVSVYVYCTKTCWKQDMGAVVETIVNGEENK